MNGVKLTKEGLENLKKELGDLIETKKPSSIERLQKARAMGDLSENSEYSSAREEVEFVEGRIKEIEGVLKHAEVEENTNRSSKISLGSKVKVMSDGKSDMFTVVGEFEADPVEKKLSYNSPIGKALMGKTVGDVINVEVPAGNITYKVLEIK